MSRPPVAARRPAPFTRHGIAVADDSAWLKDPDWQKVLRQPSLLQPDIRAYLEAENAWFDRAMSPHKEVVETLFQEMKGRIKEDDSSVPASDGAWDYYVRYEIGAEHPVHGRRPRGRDDGEVVLLDEVALAMSEKKVGSVIVNDDEGRFYGIFTATDALNALVETVRRNTMPGL